MGCAPAAQMVRDEGGRGAPGIRMLKKAVECMFFGGSLFALGLECIF